MDARPDDALEELSDVPSVALRQAVADLKAVEANPRYTVDMRFWHSPTADSRCIVCMAGAVLARRVGVPSDEFCNVWKDPETPHRDMLLAINGFRQGGVEYGLERLGIDCPPSVPNTFDFPTYGVNQEGFYAGVEHVARVLENAGL